MHGQLIFELNPIEKLWDLIQDQTASKLWPMIECLDQAVGLHLQDWWEAPEKSSAYLERVGYVFQQTIPEVNAIANLFRFGITEFTSEKTLFFNGSSRCILPQIR